MMKDDDSNRLKALSIDRVREKEQNKSVWTDDVYNIWSLYYNNWSCTPTEIFVSEH